jgi:hypothetical protein
MQAAQFARDRVEVGDDLIARHVDVVLEMFGENAIATAGQQLGAAPDAAVSVQGHRDLDVVKELVQSLGFLRAVQRLRKMVRIVVGMAQ